MKKLFKIMIAAMLCMSMCACSKSTDTTSGDATSGNATAGDVTTGDTTVSLTDTTWTTDVGEDYGAATQEDDEEPLTTLTLHFTKDQAYNVVGDISFNYKLNDDGTIDVSDLDLGSTSINPDVFELYMEDGQLVLHARINGGNATLTFEQE